MMDYKIVINEFTNDKLYDVFLKNGDKTIDEKIRCSKDRMVDFISALEQVFELDPETEVKRIVLKKHVGRVDTKYDSLLSYTK